MMTVRTSGGAVYSIAYRDLDGSGDRLAVLRQRGPDDPVETNRPMEAERWYHVTALSPRPPTIGERMAMILEPVEGDTDPIVRYSTIVISTVGLL